MTLPVTAGIVRLCGTDASESRCIALAGEIGQAVRCTIATLSALAMPRIRYRTRGLQPARQRHGLPPL